MPRRKASTAAIEGRREAQSIAATLGRELRDTRKRRRLTQAALGERIGLSQSEISYIERGHGHGTSLERWIACGVALKRPLAVAFSRELVPAPTDAGHLAGQELVLRLARAHGRTGLFELPSRPGHPLHSTDVGIRDEAQRLLILVEIWNRVDDLGAAFRATDRKAVEAGDLAPVRRAALSRRRLLATDRDRSQPPPRATVPGGRPRSPPWIVCRVGQVDRGRRGAAVVARRRLDRPFEAATRAGSNWSVMWIECVRARRWQWPR